MARQNYWNEVCDSRDVSGLESQLTLTRWQGHSSELKIRDQSLDALSHVHLFTAKGASAVLHFFFFLAVVTAARESCTAEIHRLQTALKSMADEIASLQEKQTFCERQSAALWYVLMLVRCLRRTEMLLKQGEQRWALSPGHQGS